MKTLAPIALALIATATSALAAFDPFAGPKPVAIFIEQNPWLMVIGSDTPRVAIYENGDVVFVKQDGKSFTYRTTRLSPAQMQEWQARWLPVVAAGLKHNYELSGATDQPSAMIYVREGDRTAATYAYGLSCRGRPPAPIDAKPEDRPPLALFELHKALCAFDAADSKAWVSRYIEVMLWDFSHSTQPATKWPSVWPSLKSERTIKRGDSYSIFLDSKDLPKLDAFIDSSKGGPIELDGRKWSVAYRFTFPNEPMWRNALSGGN